MGQGSRQVACGGCRHSVPGARVALMLGIAAAASALLAGPALGRNAYVANYASNTVSVIDTATDATVGSQIPVGGNPTAVAITPDGARAFVTNQASDTVSVIDTATNATATLSIPAGNTPLGIAITPDGARAYVTNYASDTVSVIDTATNSLLVSPIPVGNGPQGIAITPDGARAYVANQNSDTVSVIDSATNATVGSPIAVDSDPHRIAITPDGARAYVTNYGSDTVSVIDTATNATATLSIPVGNNPLAVAITPNGARAYVANNGTTTVSVIDTATNATNGSPIPVGNAPGGIAITPDGARAYVSIENADTISVIDTATNTKVGASIPAGDQPSGIAVIPDQGPSAAFSATRRATRAAAGQPTVFDGRSSSDTDGTVTRYDWDFGDGATLADGGPTPSHTYATPGTYTATLTVTDKEGCSTQFVFTGQTASCNGSAAARSQMSVSIPDADPPDLVLSGKKKQRLAKAVKLKVASNEQVSATASGKLVVNAASRGGRRAAKARRFKLRPQTKTLAAAAAQTFKLKLSKKAFKAVSAVLADGGRAKARLKVKATDQAGNGTTGKRAVKLT